MYTQTIEIRDPRNNDYSIYVSPPSDVERIDSTTKPGAFWFHFDVAKYDVQSASITLLESMQTEYLKEIKHWADKCNLITDQLNQLKEQL